MNNLKNILFNVNLGEKYYLLTLREKTIISLYYLYGYRDREIAKSYGVTQQLVNRLRKKGIKKLKQF